MIVVLCSNCASKLKAPDAAKGRQLKCPQCGHSVVVGEPEPITNIAMPPEPLPKPLPEPVLPDDADPGYAMDIDQAPPDPPGTAATFPPEIDPVQWDKPPAYASKPKGSRDNWQRLARAASWTQLLFIIMISLGILGCAQ